MDISGEQRKLLRKGFDETFTPDRMAMFLSEDLGRKMHNIVPPGPFDIQLYKIISAARAEGWLDQLVLKAVLSRPKEPIFARLAAELGLTPGISHLSAALPVNKTERTDARGVLESIVRGRPRYIDIDGFLASAFVLRGQICRIETTNPDGNGTGFLVGPDLVLTNYHVMKPVIDGAVAPQDVVFRFDYRHGEDGVSLSPGIEFRMKTADWMVHARPYSEQDLVVDGGVPAEDELDYCLVRLQQAVGETAAGSSNDPNADERGWITTNLNQSSGAEDDDIFILQHPNGLPMKMAIGAHLGFSMGGMRMRYDADTQGGSSGSPVFNADLDLIGLHHRGDPLADQIAMTAEHNQGIPISRVLTHMHAEGVKAFWEL